MSNYERLEDLKLAKEFPANKKEFPIVHIYEDDFDWLMEQAQKLETVRSLFKDNFDDDNYEMKKILELLDILD